MLIVNFNKKIATQVTTSRLFTWPVARPIIPVADDGLPLEWEYDDADFVDKDLDRLKNMLPVY